MWEGNFFGIGMIPLKVILVLSGHPGSCIYFHTFSGCSWCLPFDWHVFWKAHQHLFICLFLKLALSVCSLFRSGVFVSVWCCRPEKAEKMAVPCFHRSREWMARGNGTKPMSLAFADRLWPRRPKGERGIDLEILCRPERPRPGRLQREIWLSRET